MVGDTIFTVYTHHKSLPEALNARQDNYSPRAIRQLEFIPRFTSSTQYIKCNNNEVADVLSRTTINAIIQSEIDRHKLAAFQNMNAELNRLRFATQPLWYSKKLRSKKQASCVIFLRANHDHLFRSH